MFTELDLATFQCLSPTVSAKQILTRLSIVRTQTPIFKFCFHNLSTLAKRDEDGHVILEPHNFITMKPKKGALDAALIGKPSYVTNGDPYKPVKDRVMRTSDP